MNGKGSITHAPNNRLRALLAIQLLWLLVVCFLGAWWGNLLLKQASRIDELERALGILNAGTTRTSWEKTQRMLLWESGTFFVLLLSITALLVWLHWRDMKRAKSIQAFFASVTHELRTPLTSIRLQAESIAESLTQTQAHENLLVQRLLEDTLRLESQVERTLELARVEGGGPVFSQSLRLRLAIERTMKSWRETHPGRLEVKNQVQEETVMADPTAIQVILKNLVENSLKHSRREKVQVTISSESKEGRVRLRFEDDGEGFAEDTDRLGELFQKGRNSQGTGVGLYLVRTLMKRMGGRVEFNPGRGFVVDLWFQEGRADG